MHAPHGTISNAHSNKWRKLYNRTMIQIPTKKPNQQIGMMWCQTQKLIYTSDLKQSWKVTNQPGTMKQQRQYRQWPFHVGVPFPAPVHVSGAHISMPCSIKPRPTPLHPHSTLAFCLLPGPKGCIHYALDIRGILSIDLVVPSQKVAKQLQKGIESGNQNTLMNAGVPY